MKGQIYSCHKNTIRSSGKYLGMIIDTEFNSAGQLPAKDCLQGAELAERQGFGCVWKGESNSRDPVVLLSAMAARTRRVELGTAVYHIFGRSPVTLAIQAATLNDLSDGRLILGLGVANENIARWHGQDLGKPLAQMREYIEVLRAAYSGERVRHAGRYQRCDGFKLAFDASAHPLRIWLAGLGPMMSRLAGRVSEGILINMANPAMIREIVEHFHEGARQAGRDPSSLAIVAKVRVSLNEDVAKAREALKKVLTFYALAPGYRELLIKMGWGQVVSSVREAYTQGGFHVARRQVPDEMLEDVPMCAGRDIEDVRAKLVPYAKAGVTRCVVPYVMSGDDLWSETRAFLEMARFDDAFVP